MVYQNTENDTLKKDKQSTITNSMIQAEKATAMIKKVKNMNKIKNE